MSSDMVFLLPCPFNFRTDHCQYGLICHAATSTEGNDIQILHGSRSAFFNENKFPLFKQLYEKFEKVNDKLFSHCLKYGYLYVRTYLLL